MTVYQHFEVCANVRVHVHACTFCVRVHVFMYVFVCEFLFLMWTHFLVWASAALSCVSCRTSACFLSNCVYVCLCKCRQRREYILLVLRCGRRSQGERGWGGDNLASSFVISFGKCH